MGDGDGQQLARWRQAPCPEAPISRSRGIGGLGDAARFSAPVVFDNIHFTRRPDDTILAYGQCNEAVLEREGTGDMSGVAPHALDPIHAARLWEESLRLVV